MAVSTQARAGTIPVTTEVALNAAIAAINRGGGDTTIDVQGGFTLTGDTTAITASMTITSSNGSAVNDGGHAFLTVGNSATVTVSLNAGGSGMNVLNDDATTLIGLTGGVLANLTFNAAGLTIAVGQRFVTGGINLNPNAGITLGGTLENSAPIVASQSLITTTATGAQANDIYLYPEAFLIINSGTVFKAGRVIVDGLASIYASGSENATLVNSDELLVQGQQDPLNPGVVGGVSVGNIHLVAGGRFTCNPQASAPTPGCDAGVMKNDGGHFNANQSGTWNIAFYEQSDGVLTFTLPDFSGAAPVVNIAGKATFTGGEIQISSQLQYVQTPVYNKVITLLTSGGGLSLTNTPIKFMYFPTGVAPGLSVTSKGIAIKLTINTPPPNEPPESPRDRTR